MGREARVPREAPKTIKVPRPHHYEMRHVVRLANTRARRAAEMIAQSKRIVDQLEGEK